jgi:hypothetical protein
MHSVFFGKTGVTAPPPVWMEGQATVVQMAGLPCSGVVTARRREGEGGAGSGGFSSTRFAASGGRPANTPIQWLASRVWLIERLAGLWAMWTRYPVSILARFLKMSTNSFPQGTIRRSVLPFNHQGLSS